MPPLKLTDEEVDEALWEVAKKLGHSREALDEMLAKGNATPRELLKRLQRRHRSATVRIERNDAKRWKDDHADARQRAFLKEQRAAEMRLNQLRATQTLPERVARLMQEASLAQEGTKGTSFDTRISTGEKVAPMPSLDGQPLAEEVRELLIAVVERAEADVDAVARSLPPLDGPERNKLILKRTGAANIVALRFGVSEAHVRKLRAAAGLRAGDGTPKERVAA